MDCDFSPSSPHLLPNGLFSPQNRISFELIALSGLSGFSTFKGGKMLVFQGFANSRIVREFPPFSFKVRIATLTRNAVVAKAARGFESHLIRHVGASCISLAPTYFYKSERTHFTAPPFSQKVTLAVAVRLWAPSRRLRGATNFLRAPPCRAAFSVTEIYRF